MAENLLTKQEIDIIGEIANISLGNSATALNMMVQRPVTISVPNVSTVSLDEVVAQYKGDCICVQIRYTDGLDGRNILIINEHDTKVITDLMMCGDGTNIDTPLNELHISAVSEAMNQMMGSAVTSLSNMFARTIDISPPISTIVKQDEMTRENEIWKFLGEPLVQVALRLQVGDLIDSTMVQLYPIEFAKGLCKLPLIIPE